MIFTLKFSLAYSIKLWKGLLGAKPSFAGRYLCFRTTIKRATFVSPIFLTFSNGLCIVPIRVAAASDLERQHSEFAKQLGRFMHKYEEGI